MAKEEMQGNIGKCGRNWNKKYLQIRKRKINT